MTQRERQASGAISAAAPRPAAGPVLAARPGAGPAPVPQAAFWEDFFTAASPTQQKELLSLAGRQGVLYGHQLPAAGNGTATDRNRHFLSRLLRGQTDELDPVHAGPLLDLTDPALDLVQREAVAKALATPDICLIQGLPGTGKSRVVAEVIAQAAARGERVLLLAPSTAAIDRVLELIGNRAILCPVRCLGREERCADLPAASAALTFAAQAGSLRQGTLEGARRQIETAEQRYRRRQQDEPVWGRLQELVGHGRQLDEHIEALRQKRAAIADEVERDAAAAESQSGTPPAGSYHAALHKSARRRLYVRDSFDHELADLRGKSAERHQQLIDLASQISALRPLADAKNQKRWWTGAWWRATFLENSAARLAELQALEQQAQEGLRSLEEETERVSREQAAALAAVQAERAELLAAEAARRQAEQDDQEAVLQRERQLLQNKWQVALGELAPDSPRPAALTFAAFQEARDDWRRRREQEERQRAFGRQWAAFLNGAADTLAGRLAGYVNLVAATTTAIAGDEHFGDASPHGLNFDLLILEEAHLATESEFLNAARRARRWVLVGEPDTEPATRRSAEPVAPLAPSRPRTLPSVRAPVVRSATLRPGFLQPLWQHLHCDPRHWPYAWVQENERLCCRLRPLSLEQRQWLECERVADFPDIELRILTLPRTEPALAEVVFPPTMSIEQAKEYIFKELQALPVQALGHSLRWIEEPDRLVLRLADTPPPNPVPVLLGSGVREFVAATRDANGDAPLSTPWHTCRLEFDCSAGWQRPRAEEWVRHHLGIRDLGRTVRLDVPHRMHPDLAAVIADWLFAGGYHVAGAAPATSPPCPNGGVSAAKGAAPVEFVPVPPLETEASGRRREAEGRGRGDGRRPAPAPAARPAKGGAGLELDLADLRHRDRLPAELRPGLPDRGFVNYLEAQAVVRAVAAMLADPSLRSGKPTIGVMALYPAQVELIRRLLAQVPALAAAGLEVQVDLPSAFRQRECALALLSLTRSHTHRAVSFGSEPQLLPLALTRARNKLVVFGDAGTLARRSQWEGPLDHLDEVAAARERELVAQLVRYVHGQGTHARAFHLREGTPP